MESGAIRVSFITRFKDATIGFSGYPRLARDKAGGFGYLAILLLIVLSISAAITTVQFSRGVARAIPQLEKAPDFAFRKGELQFNGPMPYRLADGKATVVIDTTGQTTVADISKHGPGSILLTRDTMYQVQPGGQVKTTDLRSLPVELTKQDVIAMLPKLPRFVPFVYVLIYVGQLGFKALDALLLALVGLLYGSVTGRRVPFELGYKLGLYAMTLPILIQWIWPNFTTLSLRGIAIWWALAILYLIMGLRAYHAAEAEETPAFYPGEE